jgi:hypothetical protein
MPECADCGVEVQQRRDGKWAERITDGWRGWSYCCRTVSEWDAILDAAVLISADYHYVEGEEQRRFRKDDAGGAPGRTGEEDRGIRRDAGPT